MLFYDYTPAKRSLTEVFKNRRDVGRAGAWVGGRLVSQ